MRHLVEIHLAGAAIIALLLGIVGFAIGTHFGDPLSGHMLGAAAAFVGGIVGWYAAQFGMALVEVALFILFPPSADLSNNRRRGRSVRWVRLWKDTCSERGRCTRGDGHLRSNLAHGLGTAGSTLEIRTLPAMPLAS